MSYANYAIATGPSLRWQRPLERVEFYTTMTAVFLAPFISIRLPNIYITASDVLFLISLLMRLRMGVPLRVLGAGHSLWLLGLILLSGGLYLGSLLNGDPIRGLVVTLQYQFSYLLLPLAVLGRPLDQALKLVKCGAVSVVILCLVGFAFYLVGYSSNYEEHFEFVTGNGRLASFTDSANGLGGLIVMALPLLGFLALARLVSVFTAILYLSIMIVALVLTASNTGLITAAVCVAVFLLVHRNFRLLLFSTTLGSAGWFAILNWGQYFLPETFQKRVMTALLSGDVNQLGTFGSRYDLMVEATGMLDKHLIVGLGADQYRLVSMYDLPVHNMYLLLSNEGGMFALLGWLLLQAGALAAVFAARHRPYGQLALCTTITMIAVILTFGFASSHIYARYLILPLLLALSPSLAKQASIEAPQDYRGRRFA